nr:PAS domain S-box protein [Candidatus Desulfatibia profunda]
MTANILIVDDGEQIRRRFGRILKGKGYILTEASSAEAARELLKNQTFELILCDIGLPGESGLDFIRFALPEYPHTAAIMVTGQDDFTFLEKSLEIGVYGYITKPFERDMVLFSVASALRRRELVIANRAYHRDLEKIVAKRTAALEETNKKLQQEMAERKRTRDVLKESEGKYRLIISHIPGFVYKGYKDWSVDFTNNKVGELTGYNKEEFDARRLKWSDLIFKEDIETVKKCVIEALETDNTYIREYRIKTKSGETLWTQDRGQVIRDQKGEIDYFSGIFFDITEQKQAEEKLRQNERYYRSILKYMHESIVVINRDYQITDANNTFLANAGRSREKLLGRHCYEISHGYNEPCHLHGEDCKLLEVFETGEPRQCLHEHLGV